MVGSVLNSSSVLRFNFCARKSAFAKWKNVSSNDRKPVPKEKHD